MNKQKYVDDYVVIDTEINNKGTEYAEVFQISAIKVKDGEIVDEFDEYININNVLDKSTAMLTNSHDTVLEDEESFDKVYPKFYEFIGDSILVGQAIKNDIDQLEKESNIKIKNEIRDTQILAKDYCTTIGNNKLGLINIAEQLDIVINKDELHSAINDCYLIMEVYEKLKYLDSSI